MQNVTQYLRERDLQSSPLLTNFLRMQRVKYLIAAGEKIEAKPGRNGGTLFSDGLFSVFVAWMDKKPIPLLNRKEYEVQEFIENFFGDEVVRQYRKSGFIYDWFVPSLNLLIEFNEKEHKTSNKIKDNDAKKHTRNLFVIHEDTVMKDLARLAKDFRVEIRDL